MAGVDSTTFTRGYRYRDNKTNQGTSTGSYIVPEPGDAGYNANVAQAGRKQNVYPLNSNVQYSHPMYTTYQQPPADPYGPSGGGGSSGGGTGGGGGNDSKSAWEDAYKKYIESLQKTRDEAMAYRKGLYEQALANNGQYYKDEQRLANREYYTRNRKLAQMYGNDLTGPGLSNRYASSALLTNALTNAKNRQNTANKSAESEYHNALSNIQNAYAQGMYNAYGTEYGIDRNIEYQKYLLEHGYLG